MKLLAWKQISKKKKNTRKSIPQKTNKKIKWIIIIIIIIIQTDRQLSARRLDRQIVNEKKREPAKLDKTNGKQKIKIKK